jgi:SAM-dependent methyltransferase
MTTLDCRFCGQTLHHVFADLGVSPLANSYVSPEKALKAERFFPLTTYVCDDCLLVQLPEVESPEEIFSDYAYFSSYSDSWLDHARAYTNQMIERFSLAGDSRIVEVASNDGYLLQYFRDRNIPVLGIEPAANVAQAAIDAGIPTRVEFFGRKTAQDFLSEGFAADLLLGNNVLAHVPRLNDFVAGLRILLKPDGVVTMEFPHLMRLVAENQFDTIYHEHFSYFSFSTVRQVFAAQDLRLFDVEELPTHGGSLRIYACHTDSKAHTDSHSMEELATREREAGLLDIETYLEFDNQIRNTKRGLLDFLIGLKKAGKTIVGYGAPAKGNTLLNYCGIGTDFLDYTVDRSPHKQGRLLPGTRIPIYAPEKIRSTRPDFVFILPWNLKAEIIGEMVDIRNWGGKFFVAIPRVEIL